MTTENPLLWQSYKLDPKSPGFLTSMRLFLKSLSTWANQMQQVLFTPALLVTVLNGSRALTANASTIVDFNSGIVSTNQSVACDGAVGIQATLQINTAVNLTLTLTHVSPAVPIFVRFFNSGAGSQTFKLAMTDVNGTARTCFIIAPTTGTVTDLTNTGVSITNAQRYFVGMMSLSTGNALFNG